MFLQVFCKSLKATLLVVFRSLLVKTPMFLARCGDSNTQLPTTTATQKQLDNLVDLLLPTPNTNSVDSTAQICSARDL